MIYTFITTTGSLSKCQCLALPSIWAGFLIHSTVVSEPLQSDFTCPVIFRSREKELLDISLETEDE